MLPKLFSEMGRPSNKDIDFLNAIGRPSNKDIDFSKTTPYTSIITTLDKPISEPISEDVKKINAYLEDPNYKNPEKISTPMKLKYEDIFKDFRIERKIHTMQEFHDAEMNDTYYSYTSNTEKNPDEKKFTNYDVKKILEIIDPVENTTTPEDTHEKFAKF